MKGSQLSLQVKVSVFLVAFAAVLLLTSAWAQSSSSQSTQVAPTYTDPASGGEMYATYCSGCHGVTGAGNGRLASSLKTKPADLTMLAKSHGNKYPRLLVYSTLRTGSRYGSSSHMIAWNDAFRHLDNSEGTSKMRIHNLTNYVETLQQK